MERNFYKNNACKYAHDINNVSYIFKIIDVFKEKQNKIFNNVITSEIVTEKCDKLLQIEKNQDIYFSTDFHGDLVAFLFSLIGTGVAKYKKNEDAVIYFNTETGTVIEKNICEYKDKMRSIIPIPNLEINKDFNGKFICGGDLIDRGEQSDVCICLMYYLLNQDLAKDKIEYLVGNHENMILDNNISILKIYDTPLFRNIGNCSFIKTLLIDLIEKNKLKFCISSGNTIFSHTIFEKKYIERALNVIVFGKFSKISFVNYFSDYNKKEYFLDEEKIIAKELINKVLNKSEFNEDNIFLLCKLLNNLFKLKSLNRDKITTTPTQGLVQYDNIFFDQTSRDGLLWSREFTKSDEQINGLIQVIGHTPVKDVDSINFAKPIFNNGILMADVVQSTGFNVDFYNSDATILHFFDDKCEVEQKRIFKEEVVDIFNRIMDKKKILKDTNIINIIDRLFKFVDKHKCDISYIEELYLKDLYFMDEYKYKYQANIFDDCSIYNPEQNKYYKYLNNKISALNYLTKNELITEQEALDVYSCVVLENQIFFGINKVLDNIANIISSRIDKNFETELVFDNISSAYNIFFNKDKYLDIFNKYILLKKMTICQNELTYDGLCKITNI